MIAGYQAATIYLPAYQGQNIGGDLFDVFMTETGKIGVMIGDVSGKGIEAAALAASARSTVRSFAYELSSPDDAMYHTNAVLQSQISGTKNFITMFLAVIDPSTGMISYSRAGHPPAAILRRDGNVEFLREGELPIGLFAGIKYGLFENHLNPGDKIILYTDGIMEARHDGKLFDLEGVERALTSFRGASLEEIVNGLIEEARKWSEDNLQDDIAILAIERAEDEQGRQIRARN
jgi:serine phosphatase RsbU (regulator of sigma subunit)